MTTQKIKTRKIVTPIIGMKVLCVESNKIGTIIHPVKNRSMLVEFSEIHKKYIYQQLYTKNWGYGYYGEHTLLLII